MRQDDPHEDTDRARCARAEESFEVDGVLVPELRYVRALGLPRTA
ncbi:hypothetical protein ACIRP2_31315 [Streptomyces sp. NPDC101194]